MEPISTPAQAKKVLEEADAKGRQLLEALVGRSAIELVKQHPGSFVASLEPKIRIAALTKIWLDEAINPQLADSCEALAKNDVDANVRGAALQCLCKYYRGKSDSRMQDFFARVVLDESERADVRSLAYAALSELGREFDLTHARTDFSEPFPHEVDWPWVRSFVRRLA